MRNKPLPGMMKHSPAKQTKGPTMPKGHPVTPPTEKQSKKDKGTLRSGTFWQDRAKNRPSFGEYFKQSVDIHKAKIKKMKENPDPFDQYR